MNFFTKTRVLVTIIIVLAAMNLAVLFTIGYHYTKYKYSDKREKVNSDRPGRFMAKQMHLDQEQIEHFDNSRDDFMKESNLIMSEIRETSKQIFDEIAKENTDTLKLKELNEKFGNLHKQQKQLMTNHLLNIKNSCTPQQQKHFQKFLHRMSKEEFDRRSRDHNRNYPRRGNN